MNKTNTLGINLLVSAALLAACGGPSDQSAVESATSDANALRWTQPPESYSSIGAGLEAFGPDGRLFLELFVAADTGIDLHDKTLTATLLLPQLNALEPYVDGRGYLREGVNVEALREFVLHHLAIGVQEQSALREGKAIDTALDGFPLGVADSQVAVSAAGGSIAYLTSSMIRAGEGAIYFVDAVLVPRERLTDGFSARSPMFAQAVDCVYPNGIGKTVTLFVPQDRWLLDHAIDQDQLDICANRSRLQKLVDAHLVRGRIDTYRLMKAPVRTFGGLTVTTTKRGRNDEVTLADGRSFLLETSNIHTEEGVVHELSFGF